MLTLVLLVASLQAGIIFQTNSLTVNEGETFTVNVVADADTFGLSIGALVAYGDGLVDWSNPVWHPGFTVQANTGIKRDGSKENTIYTNIAGTAPVDVSLYVAAGQVLFSFDITAGAAGTTITVADYAGTNPYSPPPTPVATKWNAVETTLAPLEITVVPEPMTMALLGLGGLFIRRRRA